MSREIKLNIEAQGAEEECKFKEWEIEDAVRTIIRAEEIKNDAELMALVAPKLKDKAKAAASAAEVLYSKGEKNEG